MDELTRLLLDAADGDRLALSTFIRRTQADVWRFCAHLVDPGAADDLTQEVYERALRALPAFRGDSSARTWLLAITRRTCIDTIRRRTRMRTRAARMRVLAVERSRGIDDGDLELEELLNQLEPDRRSAFVLTQLLGFTYQEAAEVCECPVGTIRSRVARARTDLLEVWDVDDAPGRGAAHA